MAKAFARSTRRSASLTAASSSKASATSASLDRWRRFERGAVEVERHPQQIVIEHAAGAAIRVLEGVNPLETMVGVSEHSRRGFGIDRAQRSYPRSNVLREIPQLQTNVVPGDGDVAARTSVVEARRAGPWQEVTEHRAVQIEDVEVAWRRQKIGVREGTIENPTAALHLSR